MRAQALPNVALVLPLQVYGELLRGLPSVPHVPPHALVAADVCAPVLYAVVSRRPSFRSHGTMPIHTRFLVVCSPKDLLLVHESSIHHSEAHLFSVNSSISVLLL